MNVDSTAGSGMRVAAAALFVALPILVAGVFALNLVRVGELSAQVAAQTASLTAIEERLGRDEAGDAQPPRIEAIFVPGDSPALAAANAQERLAALLLAADARLIEVRSADEGSTADGNAGDVRLSLTFDASNGALLRALHAIEASVPLFVIERLEVRPVTSAGETEAPILRTTVVVRGHRATGSS